MCCISLRAIWQRFHIICHQTSLSAVQDKSVDMLKKSVSFWCEKSKRGVPFWLFHDWLCYFNSQHNSVQLSHMDRWTETSDHHNICYTAHLSHTHTHPFNGPLSRTTRVSRYQKGKTNLDFTEARDSEWHWHHQLGRMQVCTSLLTDNHASTPPLSFLQAGCPSCRPTNSVKGLKAHLSCEKKPIRTDKVCMNAFLYTVL